MFQRFFKAVARAAMANVAKALCECVPMGGAIFDFAKDVARHWKDLAPQFEQRRDEIAALTVCPLPDVRREAERAVADVAGDQPEAVRVALVTYLTHLPGTVRRSLSRPADLSGTTVPVGVRLDRAEDVLPFLPSRASHRALHPGKQFGDWELVELVGVGGFGEVWKATNPHLPPAAFKFCTDGVAAKALRTDAALLGRVQRQGRHPGIVSLDDTNFSHDPPYLRFEFVAGGDLTGLIHEWGRLDPSERVGLAVREMQRLATIVGFAHTLGIVHRDLKPANILLERRGEAGYELRVADFGIGGIAAGKALQETKLGTTPGEFLTEALRGACTPLYASPQQRRGENPDPRDDVYALGVIWYQMLVADVQAEVGGDWREEVEECQASAAMVAVLARCLAGKVEKRIADGNQLAAAIGDLRDPPRKETPVEQPPPAPAVVAPAIVKKEPAAGVQSVLTLPGGVEMKFAYVPAGTFWMGGGGGKPGEKQVNIEKPFALGIYQVTQGQWRAVMGNNPSWFSRRGGGADKVKDIADAELELFPVEQVSWDYAQAFVKKLNERERNTGYLYRLPGEAEWEYACRGGALSPEDCSWSFYLDKPSNTLSPQQANFSESGLHRTTKVGSYRSNVRGLHDLHGNVSEWCENDAWTGNGGPYRVFRGGNWGSFARSCTAASRQRNTPNIVRYYLGLRLARVSSGE